MRETFQLRPEQPHHVVARRHEIGLRSPVRLRAASEFRSRQQQPRPLQSQPADHTQAGFGLPGDTRRRTVVSLQQRPGRLRVLSEQGQQLGIVQRLRTACGHFIVDVFHRLSRRSTLSSSEAHCSSLRYCDTENDARCSASFFESPAPCPTSISSTSTVQ